MLAMFEIVLVVFVMTRVAEAESRSPWIWGGLTLATCLAASAVIPLVYVAPIVGGVVVFLAMLIANALRDSA